MLTDARKMARNRIYGSAGWTMSRSAWKAPTITIPDTALVTLISGECKTGVTCQMAK